MSTVVLVSDQIYRKTRRHLQKVVACAGHRHITLAIVEGLADQDFNAFARDLNVEVAVGSIAHLASVLTRAGEPPPTVVALNQSAILPALALRQRLGVPLRCGLLAACDKRMTRRLLYEYGAGLGLEYREVLPGDFTTFVPPFDAAAYVVKPAFGMSSADVKRYARWEDALAYARRPANLKTWVPQSVMAALDQGTARTDARLIEPYLEGTEFSVDGWIKDGSLWSVVQHKLHMNEQHTFIGDGTTVSPPIAQADLLPPNCTVLSNSEEGIREFARQVLQAIGYTDGVFHMEAREHPSDGRLQLIEVNPRAPGGSLWRSVLLRTGYDLERVDAAIQLGLAVPPPRAARADHVLHHPFYATRPGTLENWGQLATLCDPRNNRYVDCAVDLKHKFKVQDLNEEPYLAFAVAGASTFGELLTIRDRILRLQPPQISSAPSSDL